MVSNTQVSGLHACSTVLFLFAFAPGPETLSTLNFVPLMSAGHLSRADAASEQCQHDSLANGHYGV